MTQSNLRFVAVFLISVLVIAFQLAVMRSFSVGSWSNFGELVISIALFGFGLAGTAFSFLRDRIAKHPNRWLQICAMALAPTMVVAHVLAQLVPFRPVLIGSNPAEAWWIVLYYGIYAVPFLIGAAFIGVCFIALSSRLHRLYFWNLAGSGVGGFLLLGTLYFLPPHRLLLPLVVLGLVAAALTLARADGAGGRLRIPPLPALAAVVVHALAAWLLIGAGDIRVSEYKPVSYIRNFADTELVTSRNGPLGAMEVYRSSFLHFAPGLSDNASFQLEQLPRDAFWGLYIDGDGPIGMLRNWATQFMPNGLAAN